MFHKTPASNLPPTPEPKESSLSELSLASVRSAITVNPIIPEYETSISQVLARAAGDPFRVHQIKALQKAGIKIEDDPVSGEALVLRGGYGRLPLNSKSWISRLDPSESPYDASVRHIQRHSPEHSYAYEYLASKMTPMRPRCALTICIPVTSEEKGETLVKTLANLSHQYCSKDLFEVLLLINDPYNPGQSSEEIDRVFLQRCEPLFGAVDQAKELGLTVEVFAAAAPPDRLAIGHIRAALHCVAIERYRQRGPNFPDHLLMRADADMDFVEPTFVESLLE